jgi:hypothetical protein
MLNNAALAMGEMVGAGWISESEVRAAFQSASQANGYVGDKGWPAFNATFASGMKKGKDQPRKPLEDRLYANDDEARLHAAGDETARLLMGGKYKVAEVAGVAEAPRPLFRELAAASPYPVDALGSVLASAANAIVDRIRCPDALAAQSVLAAASLAVQGEKALREAYAAEVPEYLKLKAAWDAARKKALDGAKDDKHVMKGKLDGVGDAPPTPLEPMLTCGEPTFEGLCKLLAGG